MIYCDLLKKNQDSVIYSFSSGIGKCGKIKFPLYILGEPQIIEEPEIQNSKYYIGRLYFKYYKDFLEGKTPQKMSYEF